MLIDFLSPRRRSSSADEVCYWEGSSSELGLDTGGSDPAPAPQETSNDQPAGDDPAPGAESAEPEVDDADRDPLDLLTERDDQEEGAPPRTEADRIKSLTKRARSLEKRVRRDLPVIQALRESGLDLKTLITSHNRLAAFEQSLDRNPRLRALLNGEDDPHPASPRRTEVRGEEESVDYPFDTRDEVGKFVSDFHKGTTKEIRDLKSQIAELTQTLGGRVGRIEQGTVAQQRSATLSTWKSAATAAAEKIDPALRPMFLDSVHNAAEAFLAGRHKFGPQHVIDHYLKGVNASQMQKNRASAAAKQNIAERNNNLPRRPGQASGTPASAARKTVPRMEDFNRTLARTMGR
jgi:hypothetical protein